MNAGTETPGCVARYSWSEFLDLANGNTDYDGRRSSRAEGRGWDNDLPWEDAWRYAATGWRSAELDRAKTFATAVASQVVAERLATSFDPVRSVSGSTVDVAAYLQGVPECMIDTVPIRHNRQGRAVRLAVPVCYSASITMDTALRRGSAVMALVEALAIAQHPLEVWAVDARCGKKHDTRSVRSVLVQPANQPLDMGRVAFALANPAMLRRLLFSVDEVQPAAFRKHRGVGGGYGSAPYTARVSDLPELPGNTIVLPDLRDNNGWSESESVQWVETQLDMIKKGAE